MLPSRIFFDNLFDDFEISKRSEKGMKCDIYEEDGKYKIVTDVPGFRKEDIKLELNNGYLTISAEKKAESNDEGKKYIRRERYYSKEMRQFYVGDIDIDDVKAKFNDGILTVSVPKEEKEKETKRVINID